MKDETAFRIVQETLSENRENGATFEDVLSRSRVAALRRLPALAEPEFVARRRGNILTLYQRGPSHAAGVSGYRRIASVKLQGRFSSAQPSKARQQ
jgi:hypothetical protein